ncbi:MMPL family transporter [Streptomyces sp. SID5910]|uniref:MMPL family transporter n=1 Tax=Streptomyces sp. SID5910 TaxID=2690312 RepID=UPI00136E0377|nr:MMPL family transporter [Streptomyces sp. SID5910]MYR41103.1 MMPL family transporter [Streptomyces sp. SID5910]
MPDQNFPDSGGVSAACRRRALAVLAVAGALCALFLWASAGLHDHLARGGFTATGTQAARAEAVAERYGAARPDLIFVLTPASGQRLDSPAAARSAHRLAERLRGEPGVTTVRSAWEEDPRSGLWSADGRAGLVVTHLEGGEDGASRTAERLVPELTGADGPVTVRAAGPAWTTASATRTAADDLMRAELIAAPLTFLVLAWAFRSLAAALLPVVVGATAVLGAMAVLRVVSEFAPVSVFAQNLVGGLGFGLAVDYSLFLVGRYREETGGGTDPVTAVSTATRTVGRTVVASACILSAGLAVLLVFPFPFLKSMACAGIAVTVLAAATSLLVVPAALTLLGPWIERTDPLGAGRRTRHPADGSARTDPLGTGRRTRHPADGSAAWRSLARAVTRRPALSAAAALAVLGLFLQPFLHVRLALPDQHILPAGAPARADARVLDDLFPELPGQLTVVLPDVRPTAEAGTALDRYGRALSALRHVQAVRVGSVGTFQDGRRTGPAPAPPEAAGEVPGKGALVTVASAAAPHSRAAAELVADIRALPAPATVRVAGAAVDNVDARAALTGRLPLAAAILALVTLAVTAYYTRCVLVPVKVVAVAAVSLTAALGGVVHAFQDGHLERLLGHSEATGAIDATMPVLLFCIAFGLTVDYELLLLARIQDHYRATGDTTAAIVHGVARTGRVFTAAALAVAVAMGALVASDVSLLRQLGFGVALAVLVDATLVRGVLVPAVMRLMGRANWWSPAAVRPAGAPSAAPQHLADDAR